MADIQFIRIDDLASFATLPTDLMLPGAADSSGQTGRVPIADLKATILASPTITGTPTAPTPNPGANTTQLATAAYVQTELLGRGLTTATSATTGTVKTNTTDVAPVVYLKSETDALLAALKTTGGVALGGTGATTAANARTSLGAAASGANADITGLTGLTAIPPLVLNFIDFGSPVGQICAFAGIDPSDTSNVDFAVYMTKIGWLECNGAEYTGAQYPYLLDVIRTKFGSGSGTFKVPDLRGRFVIGAGTSAASGTVRAIGATGGADSHTLAVTEMPSHSHTVVDGHNDSWTVANGVQTSQSAYANTPGLLGSTGGSGAHNNLPPYLSVKNYIRAEIFSVVYSRMVGYYGKLPTFAEYRAFPLP